MDNDATTGLIGTFGVLAIVLLGLGIIVRGLIGGPAGSRPPGAPAGFSKGALGRSVMALLSLAVVYKFFFDGYAGSLYSYEGMLGLAAFVLICMTLVPAIETLIGIAALTVFLIQNTSIFGDRALGAFFTLVVFYVPIRWFLGR